MNPAASVFKAYDIRGIVGQTIDERFAEHLGRAFGTEAVAAGETRRGRSAATAACRARGCARRWRAASRRPGSTWSTSAR